MQIIDTHAHYDDDAFEEDRDKLLPQLMQQGIGCIVNVGASLQSSIHSVQLAKSYPFIYAAVGIHPSECNELTEDAISLLRELAKEKKVVAVGEIGLDYYWPEPDSDLQKKWFRRQLVLAAEINLPVIIHSRDAAQDTLELIKAECSRAKETGQQLQGVIHCFSYSVQIAREYLDLGFYLGIGGVLTYKNARKLKEVVEMTPIEKLVLETDAPYLSPVPNRGKRNSSENLKYVAEEIAALQGTTVEEIICKTSENAKRLFTFDRIRKEENNGVSW